MEREWLARFRDARTEHSPPSRYSGEDGTGRIHVELDGAARDVVVVLADGWRSAVGSEGLAAAVLLAFSAASTARLIAFTTGPAAEHQRPIPPPRLQANRPTSDSLSRAWRDLREFQRRLATLHGATETASSPGGLAVATVAGGRLVGLELEPDWLADATPRDLERHIGDALRGALTLIAEVPERALEGCPDLTALLAGTSFS
jgi:hypothetical protein